MKKEETGNTGEQYTDAYGHIFIGNLSPNAKVVNVKSSNPKFKAKKRNGINAILVEQDMLDKEGNYIKTKSGEKDKNHFYRKTERKIL